MYSLNLYDLSLSVSLSVSDEAKQSGPVQLADDPLNWFGLMAPTSLVQAQVRFKSAIERIVEISNLKQELQKSLTEFECLSSDFQSKCTVESDETNEN